MEALNCPKALTNNAIERKNRDIAVNEYGYSEAQDDGATCKNCIFWDISNRIKGHNYHHPLKRTNTKSTRDDSIFKSYAEKSTNAMNEFLQTLK